MQPQNIQQIMNNAILPVFMFMFPTISVLSIYAAIVERLEIESKRFSAACWIKRC